MIKRVTFHRCGWVAASAMVVACGSAGSDGTGAPSQPSTATGTTQEPLVYFEGSYDAVTHRMDIVNRTPLGEVINPPEGEGRSAESAPVGGISLPYGAAAGQMYFSTQKPTATTVVWQGACGAFNLCGPVQAVNGYAGAVTNVLGVIDSITGTGVTATGAPYSYGTVGASSSSSFQTWTFNNPNSISFTFTGHAEGGPPKGFAPFIALREPATTGNQAFAQGLGTDFTVTGSIQVTYVGAYDSNNDGLKVPIQVMIFHTPAGTVVPGTSFTLSGSAYPLVANYRFLKLPAPVTLTAGTYSVVAYGYGATEQNENQNVAGGVDATTDTAGGRVTYTGARFGNNAPTLPTSPWPDPGVFGAANIVFQ